MLLAALDAAPQAIFFLRADSPEPLWRNARARELPGGSDGLPEIAGRPANTGWKYRLIAGGRPGRTVMWVPDSRRRMAGSMVAGSGTYCSTR